MASSLVGTMHNVLSAVCCHTTACNRNAGGSQAGALLVGRRQHTQPLHHSAQSVAQRRGFFCQAAKRPGVKKKQPPPPKAKSATKVDEKPQAPVAAPANLGASTKERSEQRAAKQEQPQQQQPEAQQAEAEVVPASQAGGEQQIQKASSAEEPELKPAELRKQQQQQQAMSKPNLLEGVLQEVQLIEWPSIPSALLNTVLVISIVAGVSVLLFFVNSLLAETATALYGMKAKS